MLRLSTRRSIAATRRLHDATHPSDVTTLPRGMHRFQLSTSPTPQGVSGMPITSFTSPHTTRVSGATSSSSTLQSLPPWPADIIEFNALSLDGGQAAREAWQLHTRLGHNADTQPVADERKSSAAMGRASVPKTMLLTIEALRQLAAAEEEPSAQAALAVGGWVCTGCWTVQGGDGDAGQPATTSLPRTVCPTCHTLRHDVSTWSQLSSLLLQRHLWRCMQCGEVNTGNRSNVDGVKTTEEAMSCRCCGHQRAAGHDAREEHYVERRQTVADETAQAALGHIVVTRNRTIRWRCESCSEINSLQLRRCRNCQQERFALTVHCPTCEAPRTLRNDLVYGPPPSSSPAIAAQLNFAPSNCYAAASTQMSCLQCSGPLHGGSVRTETWTVASWWCACGSVSPGSTYCCSRCRLPRTVSNPQLLRELLRTAITETPQWDFARCTSWFCDSCEGVNSAAYEIIVEDSVPAGAASVQPRRRRRWVDRNGGKCQHCGTPWHHQLLQHGELWRCACHAVNTRESTACASCRLPALNTLSCVVLSAWSRGDWMCSACGTHCYRDRMRCRCGADRPTSQ